MINTITLAPNIEKAVVEISHVCAGIAASATTATLYVPEPVKVYTAAIAGISATAALAIVAIWHSFINVTMPTTDAQPTAPTSTPK